MEDKNADFGLPPETEDQKLARLKAQADAMVAAEAEKELLTQLVTRARNKAAALSPGVLESEVDDNGFPRKYFKINVYKGGDKNDLPYVPVGVNGYFWKIRRGVDVIVPSVVLEDLDHAIQGSVEQITLPNGRKSLEVTDALRFPYQNKGEVSEADYKAYQAEMRAQAAQLAV